jgi:SAM-dependent methyltransferase
MMKTPFDLPVSPVTGDDNVRVVDTYSTKDIISLYRQQEKVDVSRYFAGVETLYLLECGATLYRFYFPFETAGGEEFYRELERKVEDRGLEYDRDWDEDHRYGFDQISENDSVLEIGCNSGKFLKRVMNKTNKVLGLDFNPSAIANAAARGVNAVDQSIEEHADSHPETYDVVCAFQVLEHLNRPGQVMASVKKALRPGGKLVVSVPNNEPYFQRFNKYEVMNMPPHHVGLWNLASLKRFAEHFGMTVIDHYHYGTRGILPDAYLRSKLMMDVRTLPTGHTSFV